MDVVLLFSVLLLISVLLSELASRSLLSSSVVFLIGGYVFGNGMLSLVHIDPSSDLVLLLAELALFSILFTDGMRIGLKGVKEVWRLPMRALVIGMPLTFFILAILAYAVLGSWLQACLIAAVLSPTDPVFAASLIGREDIPLRLRHLLNLESGLNGRF